MKKKFQAKRKIHHDTFWLLFTLLFIIVLLVILKKTNLHEPVGEAFSYTTISSEFRVKQVPGAPLRQSFGGIDRNFLDLYYVKDPLQQQAILNQYSQDYENFEDPSAKIDALLLNDDFLTKNDYVNHDNTVNVIIVTKNGARIESNQYFAKEKDLSIISAVSGPMRKSGLRWAKDEQNVARVYLDYHVTIAPPPPPPQATQCSDGEDNDGDSYVDGSDDGCLLFGQWDPSDNSELSLYESCTDYDDGKNYYTFSNVTSIDAVMNDTCLDVRGSEAKEGKYLKEYTCNLDYSKNKVSIENSVVSCRFGCGDGRCKEGNLQYVELTSSELPVGATLEKKLYEPNDYLQNHPGLDSLYGVRYTTQDGDLIITSHKYQSVDDAKDDVQSLMTDLLSHSSSQSYNMIKKDDLIVTLYSSERTQLNTLSQKIATRINGELLEISDCFLGKCVAAGVIGALDLHTQGITGKGVRVAILDTGIDTTHPDLLGKVILEKSFILGETVADGNGHGTHVAGIIAGSGAASNGKIKGVSPGVDLMIGKVLNNRGSGSISGVIEGIDWAVANGADVISMSLGSSARYGRNLDTLAVQEAWNKGVVVVVAAGNDYWYDPATD